MSIDELRKQAAWENSSGADAAALELAKQPGDAPVNALIAELLAADQVDLGDDAGDVGDELFRLRSACAKGLIACGPRAIPLVLAAFDADRREPRDRIFLRVLSQLGEARAMVAATKWLEAELREDEPPGTRMEAITALGFLAPKNGSEILQRFLARNEQSASWHKRLAGVAFARMGDIASLEKLLDDPDWFARLGAVEGLKLMPRDIAERLLQRAARDSDERVRNEAKVS